MTCDNCGGHFADHCRVHLIPCCPGKCPAEEPREWAVACSATYSCGWSGVRVAARHTEAQAEPCPNCGEHVRASGSRRIQIEPGQEEPGLSPSRYHLL
jgi:hypothetical protein